MRKIVAITAVVLIALLALGLGFARWFEVLTINGTVNTGTVDADLTLTDWGDTEPDPEKNYSWVLEPTLHDDDGDLDMDRMEITIEGAYPCIYYWVIFDVHSIGTVPIHVSELVGSGDLPAGAMSVDYGTDTGPVDADGVPTVVNPISLDPYYQLHNGETIYGRIKIHFTNAMLDAEPEGGEGQQYTFSLPLDCGQWNEAP